MGVLAPTLPSWWEQRMAPAMCLLVTGKTTSVPSTSHCQESRDTSTSGLMLTTLGKCLCGKHPSHQRRNSSWRRRTMSYQPPPLSLCQHLVWVHSDNGTCMTISGSLSVMNRKTSCVPALVCRKQLCVLLSHRHPVAKRRAKGRAKGRGRAVVAPLLRSVLAECWLFLGNSSSFRDIVYSLDVLFRLTALQLCHTWSAVTPPTLLELCRERLAVTPPTLLDVDAKSNPPSQPPL